MLVGYPMIYTIRCENLSDFSVSNVIVKDVLPANLSYVGAFPPPDTTETLPVLTWSLGDLDAWDGRTIILTTTAPSSPGIITNTAMADAYERIMTHTIQSAHVITEGAILQLTKLGSATDVFVGGKLVYTLQYENVGNRTSTGAVLTDILPDDIIVVGVYPTATVNSSESLVWDIGQVLVNAPGTAVITATVWGQERMVHNVADITSPNSFPGHAEWNVHLLPAALYLPIVVRNP